jgi:lysophospholipase L1-like esterase
MSLKTLLIILAGFIMLTILWSFFNREPKVTNFPTSGTTIVAFGDSLTEGVGTTEGNDYASLLSARIGEPIINMGVSGDTTADGLKRLEALLEEDPKVVILELGGNDALKRVPVETTFQNLSTIIERVQATGAGVVLVGISGAFYGTRYDKEFEKLSRTYGTAYVPNIVKGLLGKPELMADSIHPNDAGHIIMADRIEPKLREILRVPDK